MADDLSLFKEIDDAVRHDRMLALWKQYRMPVLAAAFALVAATAGMNIWRGYQAEQAGRAMQQLSAAQQQFVAGKYAAAAEQFAALVAKPNTGNVHDLALLWQARAQQAAGQDAQAIALYAKLADHPKGDDMLWRDLACLRLVALDPKQDGCLRAGASPLGAERSFIRAANLWQAGKADAAAREFEALSRDNSLSRKQRERAAQYLSVVAADVQQ